MTPSTTNAARHLAALARCAAVAKRVEAGESQASIARELNVSRARVSQMVKFARFYADLAQSSPTVDAPADAAEGEQEPIRCVACRDALPSFDTGGYCDDCFDLKEAEREDGN